MSQERLIKKYANRRLYDASVSRHVTLDDIRELIIKGEKIRVVEDKSGEDITRLILLQVIAEQEQFGRPILSTPLLESIIRFYGNGLHEFMGRYLERSVEAFTQQQQSVQSQLAQLMQHTPMSAMAELARQNMEAWQKMQASMFSGGANAGTSAGTSAAPGAGPSSGASAGTSAGAGADTSTSSAAPAAASGQTPGTAPAAATDAASAPAKPSPTGRRARK